MLIVIRLIILNLLWMVSSCQYLTTASQAEVVSDIDTVAVYVAPTLEEIVDSAAVSKFVEEQSGGASVHQKAEAKVDFDSAEEAVEYMENSGEWEKYSEGVLPVIASQSLTYVEKLLSSETDYFVIVDKGRMKLTLYDRYGRAMNTFGIACSRKFGHKRAKRDNRTPEGYFTAEGVFDSTDWKYTDDDGYTSPTKGVYGTRFIRIAPMIGIHGTNAPGSIGTRASHGCIRLTNSSILELVKYARRGMPIIVNPGKRDQEVNREEGNEIVMLDLSGKKPEKRAELTESE